MVQKTRCWGTELRDLFGRHVSIVSELVATLVGSWFKTWLAVMREKEAKNGAIKLRFIPLEIWQSQNPSIYRNHTHCSSVMSFALNSSDHPLKKEKLLSWKIKIPTERLNKVWKVLFINITFYIYCFVPYCRILATPPILWISNPLKTAWLEPRAPIRSIDWEIFPDTGAEESYFWEEWRKSCCRQMIVPVVKWQTMGEQEWPHQLQLNTYSHR